jgi:hypothetical protein
LKKVGNFLTQRRKVGKDAKRTTAALIGEERLKRKAVGGESKCGFRSADCGVRAPKFKAQRSSFKFDWRLSAMRQGHAVDVSDARFMFDRDFL